MVLSKKLSSAIAVSLMAVAVPVPVLAQDEAALERTAPVKQLLTAGSFREALTEATALRMSNPADYEAVYYVAMAQLGLGNLDAAMTAARQAQTLAPADSAETIAKLVATIEARRNGEAASPEPSAPLAASVDNGVMAEAEVALEDGLVGKAARLYDSAWAAGRGDAEAGLKAASLYADRLGQYADAGRVLNEVVKSYPESPAAAKATAELSRLASQLQTARSNLVVRAWAESWPEAEKTLLAASAIEPTNAALIWIRLAKGAEAGDGAGVRTALTALAKLGPIDVRSLAVLPGMEALVRDAEFSEFLLDVLGSERHASLSARVSPPPATNVIATLAAQKNGVAYFSGMNCDAARTTCTYSSSYPITGVGGPSRCDANYALGRPSFNTFTDLITSWNVRFDQVRGLRLYKVGNGDPAKALYYVERIHKDDDANSRSRGWRVVGEAQARALARQLQALRIACGNTEWPS